MNDATTEITIAISTDLERLLHLLPGSEACDGDRVALVHSGLASGDLSPVSTWASGGDAVTLIDAGAISSNPLDRTRRIRVDVDAVAPRLRQIDLPAAVVEATRVVAAIDARSDAAPRPDLVLGLWAKLVPSRHRLAARLTGFRDGLTAEFLLARPPGRILILDRVERRGPLVATSGSDPIAVEVIALALRDVRRSTPSAAPGPWEDPLVQRATELGLGRPGPTFISIAGHIDGALPRHEREQLTERVHRAASRAGIDSIV
ncbi:MAG: hypothetical protein IT335_09620 [Thermomicrobiales bacterium]|jgi:hypothetical protein|nr:hypothetical protein [Thermomicrobiales bacterium]